MPFLYNCYACGVSNSGVWAAITADHQNGSHSAFSQDARLSHVAREVAPLVAVGLKKLDRDDDYPKHARERRE
jgi:hypothetical protein